MSSLQFTIHCIKQWNYFSEQLQDEASESDVLGSPLGRQPDASLDESCLDKSGNMLCRSTIISEMVK